MVESLLEILITRRSQAFYKPVDVHSVRNAIGESISSTSIWNIGSQLTLSRRRPILHRNQSTDLQSKSMDWFLYDIGLRHERLKYDYSYGPVVNNLKEKRGNFFLIK